LDRQSARRLRISENLSKPGLDRKNADGVGLNLSVHAVQGLSEYTRKRVHVHAHTRTYAQRFIETLDTMDRVGGTRRRLHSFCPNRVWTLKHRIARRLSNLLSKGVQAEKMNVCLPFSEAGLTVAFLLGGAVLSHVLSHVQMLQNGFLDLHARHGIVTLAPA